MTADPPFGFDRSGAHNDECEEMAQLARLRLEDAMVDTIRRDREMAFGCVVTDSRMEYTGVYEGNQTSVSGSTIKRIHNEMMAINPDGDIRKEYLLHTHPGGPFPSVADIGALVSSMKLDSSGITREPIPSFDGMFNIGTIEDGKGLLLGLMIHNRPTDSEFVRIVDKYESLRGRSKDMNKKETVGEIKGFISDMEEHVRGCESEFRLVTI